MGKNKVLGKNGFYFPFSPAQFQDEMACARTFSQLSSYVFLSLLFFQKQKLAQRARDSKIKTVIKTIKTTEPVNKTLNLFGIFGITVFGINVTTGRRDFPQCLEQKT